MSWRRRIALGAGAAAGAYVAVSALMARGLTVSRRVPVLDTPDAVGLEYEDVTFPSSGDGIELAGWVIRPPAGARAGAGDGGGRWIVIVHGHGTNRADPAFGSLPLARDLHRAGYSVLMFDLRASGQSSGSRASAGYYEQRDLHGALDFLGRIGVTPERTGILGFSIGGAIALLVCAHSGRAASVVADSAFADLGLMIERGASSRFHLLRIFTPGMRFMARLLYGIDIGGVSPMRALATSGLPVLLIHGERDELVPLVNFRLLSRAIESGPGETWLVPNAGHTDSYREQPEEYKRRVVDFFNRTLA